MAIEVGCFSVTKTRRAAGQRQFLCRNFERDGGLVTTVVRQTDRRQNVLGSRKSHIGQLSRIASHIVGNEWTRYAQ
jgi:hypothetical protein